MQEFAACGMTVSLFPRQDFVAEAYPGEPGRSACKAQVVDFSVSLVPKLHASPLCQSLANHSSGLRKACRAKVLVLW